MKKTYTELQMYKAAAALKPHVAKSSHRHELVASHLGFNSKAHFTQCQPPFEFDLGDPESFNGISENPRLSVRERLESLKLESDAHQLDHITNTIAGKLRPNCTSCGCTDGHTQFLNKEGLEFQRAPWPDDPHEFCLMPAVWETEQAFFRSEWLCPSCLQDEDKAAGCSLCDGDEGPYHPDLIDEQGLCPEHQGEFDYSDEEREDMESLSEYHANH